MPTDTESGERGEAVPAPQPKRVISLGRAIALGLTCLPLLLFALALLERDGALLLVAWIAGGIAVIVFGFLSGNLVESLARLVDSWL